MNPLFRQPHHLITNNLNSPKIHNCPNCHCHSHQQFIFSKPINKNYCQRILSPPPSPSPYQSSPYSPKQQLYKKQLNQNNHRISENIYYKKIERSNSQNSVNSNKSHISINSNEFNNIKIITTPKKSINVSFRYLSPLKQQNISQKQIYSIQSNNIKQNNNNIIFNNYKQSIYHQNLQQPKQTHKYNNYPYFNQYIQQLNHYQINQPKIPNILKKKSQEKKKRNKSKSINQYSQIIIPHEKQPHLSKTYTGNKNNISNIIAYQQSTPTTEYELKGQWTTPNNVDLALEEERAVAQQLLRDLKLNYDYYETADISKYSNNAT